MARKKKNDNLQQSFEGFDSVEESQEPEGYTSEQVARITGLTLRQVDTWTTKEIVSASIDSGKGSGSTRYYSYRDILEFNVAQKLRGIGQDLDLILTNFLYVRDALKASVYDSILVCEDDKNAVIVDKESLITLAEKSTKAKPGQGILNLNILNLSEVKREVDENIGKLGLQEELGGF